MPTTRLIFFLISGALLAFVHWFAMETSLYWHYWWFDILMHFWGGTLLGLGVYTIAGFSVVQKRPTLPVLLVVFALATGAWEVFEWSNGLWDKQGYIADTALDVFLGFAGGLCTHAVLRNRTKTEL